MGKILFDTQSVSDFNSEMIPHIGSLKSYALQMTNDFDDSEDLLQETMLKAFRFYNDFAKRTNAKAWLLKIMHNSFINDYRKKTKQPRKVDYGDVNNFYDNINSDEVKGLHYESNSLDTGFDDEIMNALLNLPDEFRTIVFLCDIEGYSYEEISVFFDCPIGTIRSRIHRTRKILYALLYKYALENGYVRPVFKNGIEYNVRNN